MDAPTSRPPIARPMRGIALKLCSVLIFIVMSALIKVVSDRVPVGQTVFFRSFFAIPVILIWLAMTQRLVSGLRTRNPLGHVWRGLAGTMSMGLNFAALAYLPLPEVTALSYAAPILTVILASMFLGEEVRLFRLSAVVIGLGGVMVILWPRLTIVGGGAIDDTAALGVTLVLTAALCTALAMVFIRKMSATESTASIVFWFTITSTVLSLLTIPFGWVMPTPTEAVLLVLAGILGGVAQIFMTQAFREADASVIAPFEYASMLFALIIGYVVFSEVPTPAMLTGAAIIVAAGCLIIWRERALGLERSRQRKAMSPNG
ncbi:DMT family transporter [Falsirhodobacter sp. 20TX0035]|uniref:DMT family transporter n=1 Tax=Falsirhodobacter sp. 20TX0035 TaxID=3022019 RepID=UPI00232E261E|nr:DMT family transporter [Falsirhodobacter sp. 20TX0035]MDB6452223.1 DMT family transporter [Falsirhodobacter sp. 20TX0035]